MAQQGIGALAQGLFPDAQQDPMLQQATALQGLRQQYAGVDLSDPNNLLKLATDLSGVGAVEQAIGVAQQARAIQADIVSKTPKAKEVAEATILRIGQIPEEQRTEEDNRILNASQAVVSGSISGSQVQSAKVLPDGTTVTLYKSGKREVLNPNGEVVTSKEAADAIKTAERFGATIAGEKTTAQTLNRLELESRFASLISGARQSGQKSVDLGIESFKKVNAKRGNIKKIK
jgi:hypothetical protein